MKTIVEGSLPNPLPKWVGEQVRCNKCNSVFELEESDASAITSEKRPNGKKWIECALAECGNQIRIQ